jgi:membrane associated rhomboid family serine protease
MGTRRFLLFSLLCAVFAALAHLFTHWGELVPMIGASGAISGQMAAALRFMFSVEPSPEGARRMRADPLSVPVKGLIELMADRRILIILAVWLGLNYAFGSGMVDIGEEASIAWQAHIGGFFAGLFFFRLFDIGERA